MKKIHITESQLRYCMRRLNEMDVVANCSQNNNNANTAIGKAGEDARKNGLDPKSKDVNFVVTGDDAGNSGLISEITKADIKKARKNKLVAESYKILTKKTLKKQ